MTMSTMTRASTAMSTRAIKRISEILLIARVDMAVLGLVIVDMVTKPFS